MSLDIYSKDPLTESPQNNKKRDRYFFAIMSTVGLLAIIFAAWPFFVWQIVTLPKLTSNIDNAPIPESRVLSVSIVNSQNIQVIQDADGFSYFTTTNKQDLKRTEEFSVSIPKLNIKNAKTKVDNRKN